MNWLFWKKDRHDDLAAMKEEIAKIREAAVEGLPRWDELNGQLTKIMRLQYKAGQETQVKLEQLSNGMTKVQEWQSEYGVKTERLHALTQQREYLLEVLLLQLDEIDMACAGINDKEDNTWQPLFTQWAQRIITALSEMGIYEVDLVGKTFDPQIAEGVDSMPRMPGMKNSVPYEVAEVVKRGFVTIDGQVLRKAEVITFQEERYI